MAESVPFRSDEPFIPRIEDIRRWEQIYPNYLRELCGAISEKIEGLNQLTASNAEKVMLDRVAELGSVSARHIIKQGMEERKRPVPYPKEINFSTTVAKLHESIIKIPEAIEPMPILKSFSSEELASEPFLLLLVLENGIGTQGITVKQQPEYWTPIKSYAQSVTKLVQLIGEYNEGIKVDTYLEEKMQDLISVYNSA
jgi:hypothetical protein